MPAKHKSKSSAKPQQWGDSPKNLPNLNSEQYASASYGQFCSTMLTEAEEKLGAFALGQKSPASFPQAIMQVRNFVRDNWFISSILALRLAFYHYGFKMRSADGTKKAAVKSWWEETSEAVCAYETEMWTEWNQFDVAVTYLGLGGDQPIFLNLDQCKYTDDLGQPKLMYRHRLTTEQIDALNMPAAMKMKWKHNAEVEIPPEQYRVLKRARIGAGFGFPSIMCIAKPFAQCESMEVGDNLLGYICRNVYEQHKFGHEITSGPHAGWNTHFWKPARAQMFEKSLKGKIGHIRMTTNFDHDIVFPYPEMKHFDAAKYEAVIKRMMWWALPLGHMIEAKAVNPFLMDFLRTLSEAERARVAPNLNFIVNKVFDPPVKVVASWSNRVFREGRVAADLLKFAVSAGAASQTSLLTELGADPEEERELKQHEDSLPDSQTQPIYDPAHGPPKPAKGISGRPSGSNNK